MHSTSLAHLASLKIKTLAPSYAPRIGIVLGSGLSALGDELQDRISISYTELPGFPNSTISGQNNNLILGKLNGIDVACLQGRSHSYEGLDPQLTKTYVRTLKLLGCDYFIATNASGSLDPSVAPGELMLINDHINMQGSNPLVGVNDDEFGPRFLALDNVYNDELRLKLLKTAATLKIKLHQGVYISVLGPNYETAAEIKAFRMLGADAIGMSTVPEVIVAHHCGMKVAVIATITNYATGIATTSHDHDQVIAVAAQAGAKLSKLIKSFILEL